MRYLIGVFTDKGGYILRIKIHFSFLDVFFYYGYTSDSISQYSSHCLPFLSDVDLHNERPDPLQPSPSHILAYLDECTSCSMPLDFVNVSLKIFFKRLHTHYLRDTLSAPFTARSPLSILILFLHE